MRRTVNSNIMPGTFIGYPSPRVSQLDAYILDNELFSLLKQQLSDTFQLLSNNRWSFNQHPELWSLGLKLLIFKLTTLKTGSSYGLKLQNLKLSDSKTGKIAGLSTRYLLLASIIGDYLFKRFQSYLYALEPSGSSRENGVISRIKEFLIAHKTEVLKKTEDAVKVVELLNFVLFLVQGRYPSILHRVLGISITPVVADLLKFNGDNVNFEFQNRQLVWNVMTEFLVFILPLLQLRKLRRALRLMLPVKGGKNAMVTGASPTPLTTRFSNLPQSHCAICIEVTEQSGIKAASTLVTNAYVTNCGHIFCYVCLATRFNAIENGIEEAEGCPRCRLRLTSFKLYDEDTLVIDPGAILVEYQEVESDEEEEESQQGHDETHEEKELTEKPTEDISDGADGSSESEDYESFDENEDLEEEVDIAYEENDDFEDDYDEMFE